MQIAVTTPTGHVGSRLVPMLIRAGVRPRVLLRDPGRLDSDVRGQVDAVRVDQFDAESLTAATDGVDALFLVVPSVMSEDPLADYARAAAAAEAAVGTNRIRRVVFQSSVGAERRHGAGEIDGLAAVEAALNRTSTDVVHLRCGYFFTNLELDIGSLRTGTLRVVVPPDVPMPWVAPRDIAEVAAGRLLSQDWSGRVVQAVHGPADLSWSEVAEILTEALGRPVAVERIADDTMREQLRSAGMPERMVEAVLGMSTGLRDDFVPEQPRGVATTTPTPLGAWAWEHLRPRLG